jgi:HD-GYP domain-containing protein (c-di-GMP phosphodiesterase class II)
MIALQRENGKLRRQLDAAQKEVREARELEARLTMAGVQTVEAIVGTLEAKDPYTSGHSKRVAQLSLQMGAVFRLEQQRMWDLHIAALLHDIGKIGVYDSALNKATRLNDEEFSLFKEHPITGEHIIKKIDHFADIALIVRWHHERYDGNGYPDGKKGDEYPVEAAIICAADAFDAITSKRTYNKPKTIVDAVAEIQKHSGTQFHPDVVAALEQALKPKELASVHFDDSDFGADFEIPDD